MSSTAARISLGEIFVAYLRAGLTTPSYSALHNLRALVLEKGWLSRVEMGEGLGVAQLCPGPTMTDLVTYMGYRQRGVPGAAVALLGFALPSFALLLALTAAYLAGSGLAWVHSAFLGLEALVVGTVLSITLDLGRRAIRDRVEALLALAAFAAVLLGVSVILIVPAALALGALWLRPAARLATAIHHETAPLPARRWEAIASVIALLLGLALAFYAVPSDLGRLGLSFYKVGALGFGSSATVIPLVQAEVVQARHWLTASQLADAIALAQVTPGPLLMVAAFVGLKLSGLAGALLATLAAFAPSFAMVLILTEVYTRLRSLQPVRGAVAGVRATFVGLLAASLVGLGQVGLRGPGSLALAAGAFVAVRFFRVDATWVFPIGLVVWAGLLALGLT